MLNKKELIYRILIVAVCALLVFSACSGNDTKQVSENETGSSEVEEKKGGSIDTASAVVSGKKNETVQIKTDAEGIPDRVKVQVKLSDLQKAVGFHCRLLFEGLKIAGERLSGNLQIQSTMSTLTRLS